mmetsp:Transcript_25981/g.89640  ORF Transcript_25981/g.89640 Transcript_25981/m.89640 type:complete len:315 (+) Transcript_25981:1242-2186(+)
MRPSPGPLSDRLRTVSGLPQNVSPVRTRGGLEAARMLPRRRPRRRSRLGRLYGRKTRCGMLAKRNVAAPARSPLTRRSSAWFAAPRLSATAKVTQPTTASFSGEKAWRRPRANEQTLVSAAAENTAKRCERQTASAPSDKPSAAPSKTPSETPSAAALSDAATSDTVCSSPLACPSAPRSSSPSHPSAAGRSVAKDVKKHVAKTPLGPIPPCSKGLTSTPVAASPKMLHAYKAPQQSAWASAARVGKRLDLSAIEASTMTSGTAIAKFTPTSTTAAPIAPSAVGGAIAKESEANTPTAEAMTMYGLRWRPRHGA